MTTKVGHSVDVARDEVLNLKSEYITGPMNVVRLEGKDSGKVIYLFFDIHYDPQIQNECANVGAIDFAEFFVKTFNEMPKSNTMYDFFLEVYPTQIEGLRIRENDGIYIQPITRHIDKVIRLFSKLFVRAKSTDKVSAAELFPNLRLHYFDIRDYFEYVIKKEFSHIDQIFEKEKLTNEDKLNVKKRLQNTIQPFEQIISILKNPVKLSPRKTSIIKNVSGVPPNLQLENLNSLAYKMKHSYSNPAVKKVVVGLFESVIKNLDDVLNQIKDLIANIDDTTSTKFMEQYSETYSSVVDVYADLVDVLFLRRFLDKPYITNAIVYGGGAHMVAYLFVLIKFFDFKITHISRNRKHYSIAKINQIVKDSFTYDDIIDLFYEITWVEPQCSAFDSFPKNFL
jgi:hypothetical protein